RRGELIERSFAHCYETGRYATLPSAGAGEHSETAVGTRGSIQLEPDSAKTAGSGYAARAEKSHRAGVFATFGLCAEPDDGRFANLAAYSPGWPPDTHFSLPHISSSLAHSESFRHGLLAAAVEVGRPIAFATLIVMVVFLPLFAMSGVEGKMYSPLA